MSRKTNTCPKCGADSSDSKHTSGYCKPCSNKSSMVYQALKDEAQPFYRKVIRKKTQCKREGLDFDLTEDHLESIWTGVCPILEVPLDIRASRSESYAPHIDRIDPSKGYVKGNVQWLSARANRLKNNMTRDELERLYKWLNK